MAIVDFDFSDVDTFIDEGKAEVMQVMEEVGDMAVDYAIANGTYQNRTGELRKSNRRNVVSDGLELTNEKEYASFVESKGFDVLSSAVLEAEKELKNRVL